jgi:hypothetical protein
MKKILLGMLAILMVSGLQAQNVGIGTNTPNASASLEVAAANKGFLPPRVALTGTADVSTIASPATGLLVFNTATAGTAPANVIPGYYYYTGTSWLRISNPGNAAGDMQYWNGSQWVIIPGGATGATLTFCNGVPQWGPCGTGGGALATVLTTNSFNVAGTTASAGGNVTADGGAAVTTRGVAYALIANPTIADNVANAAAGGTGTYTVGLTGLTPNTLYHYRAFATNTAGTAYGADSTFTTTGITAPALTTTAPFGVGATTGSSGGTVTSNGGTPLTARGIVYATTTSPTLANSVITDPAIITGTYTANISGLTANTTYYVRAYATNSVGTTYGNEVSFTTLGTGAFAATYTFDNVTATSGITDPTPPPTVTGAAFGAFSAIGASANPNTGFRFSFTNWSLGATNGSDVFTSAQDSTEKYYEVTITPDQGSSISLSSISFTWQRSGSGVRQSFVRSSLDNFAANLPASVVPANNNVTIVATNKFQVSDSAPTNVGNPGCTLTLGGSAFTNISSPITFRFYGINAESTGGTFSIDNVVFNGSAN